jgi:hypothetical protein
MKDITEIAEALAESPAGTIIMIRGYTNSAGDKMDLEVELLKEGAYAELQQGDTELLKAANAVDLYESDEEEKPFALTDAAEALTQMLTAKEAALTKRTEDKEATKPNNQYIPVGPCIARHPSSPAALYIRHAKRIGTQTHKARTPKGAVPLAKQWLGERLQLPTLSYIAAIKLEPGKFEDLQIFE